MPKLTFLPLLAALVCVTANAQTPDYRFGKISIEELEMTGYEKDPDADAVYLNEESALYYTIDRDITHSLDYRARIKILKPEGTDQADITISYTDDYDVREVVSGIDAAAYNLVNGKVVKTPLKKQYIFTEQVSEHRKVIKFSIPEVREGSVIEYKFRITSRHYTYIPSMRFQHDIPVVRSYMKASIPEFFVFNINMKGYVHINVTRGASAGSIGNPPNNLTYTNQEIEARASDIPALKREPYVWSLNDFRSMLDFELAQIAFPNSTIKNYTTTWKSVNEALKASSFDTHCRIGNPFKEEIAPIKAGAGSPEEKIRQVLKVVQSKMKWNEQYRLFSKGPRAAAGKGNGSSADINFVLMAALKDAGFEAVPVLLSPRHLGRLSYTHPTIDGINTFIIRVGLGNEAYAYLDGTDPNSDINLLPVALLVDRARVYGIDNESGWCDLTKLVRNTSNTTMTLKLNTDGSLTGTFIEQDVNQVALLSSTSYTEAKSQDEYIESLEKKHSLQVDDFEIKGVGTNTVVRNYQGTLQTTGSSEFIYINATAIPFMSTNSLNAQSRTLPIEFSLPIIYNIRGSIQIPEGYTIEELPKNINMIVLENSARCRYISNVSGNFVQFHFQFVMDRIIYIPGEFPDLNTFYGAVADLSNSHMVIRKNTAQ
ncbi:DUF3857 domain-containing protein [uncultured Alistipes sp.]|jgi:hypothetical protein|uniref:DUF3857 domain-containing protein n=1 Tax=uncultured Alistipes sp. TaxID=538949 RepID=UPI0025F85014|nr:DUF3857 domain-containing protein [uncultured Alistipes sp.]